MMVSGIWKKTKQTTTKPQNLVSTVKKTIIERSTFKWIIKGNLKGNT